MRIHAFSLIHKLLQLTGADTQKSASSSSNRPQETSDAHYYIPLSSYICTLPYGCLDYNLSENVKSVDGHNHTIVALTAANELKLTPEALTCVEQLLQVRKRMLPKNATEKEVRDTHNKQSSMEECWVEYGGYVLSRKHLQQVVQGKQLCNLHINAFQCLLKTLFPQIAGLQSTLFQDQNPLQLVDSDTLTIQIIYTRKSHWATLSIEGSPPNIKFYYSAYTSICNETMETIANLIKCKEKSFGVQIMNIQKQSGADCSLYAMAVATCLAFKRRSY